jgi:hypothetical protein
MSICTFCLHNLEDKPPHDPSCPIAINKLALEMWKKGIDNARRNGPLPGDPVLAEIINLYETYTLGYKRGLEMLREE